MIQKVPVEAELNKCFVPEGEPFRNLKIVVGQEGAKKIE